MLSSPNSIRNIFVSAMFLVVIAITVTGNNNLINIPDAEAIAFNNNISNNNGDLNENKSNTSGQQHNLQIPNNVTVVPELQDKGYLALSAIRHNDSIEFTRNFDDELPPFGLNSWHQYIKFIPNYEHQVQNQNLTISNLLIGKIGNFNSFEDLLREASLYQDVPINSTVIIELPNDSVSFMMAEIKSSGPESGIYYGLFDGNQENDKTEINPSLERFVLETLNPLNIKADGSLYNVTQVMVCNDISKFGYRQCS